LKAEVSRWKPEIQYPRARKFDRAQAEAAAIQTLVKKDILEFFNTRIAAKTGRKKFSSQIFGKDHAIPTETGTSNELVVHLTDIATFKRQQELYPIMNDLSNSL